MKKILKDAKIKTILLFLSLYYLPSSLTFLSFRVLITRNPLKQKVFFLDKPLLVFQLNVNGWFYALISKVIKILVSPLLPVNG